MPVIRSNKAFATSEQLAWDAGYRSVLEGCASSRAHYEVRPKLLIHWTEGRFYALEEVRT